MVQGAQFILAPHTTCQESQNNLTCQESVLLLVHRTDDKLLVSKLPFDATERGDKKVRRYEERERGILENSTPTVPLEMTGFVSILYLALT